MTTKTLSKSDLAQFTGSENWYRHGINRNVLYTDGAQHVAEHGGAYWSSVITSKAANGYHFKTGQRDWPSGTENVLPCRLLWWQVGLGTPASGAAFEYVAVVQ